MRRSLTALALAIALWTAPAFAQVEGDFSQGGGIRVGDSTTACASAIEGAIRYDSDSGKVLAYCNGTSWLNLNTGGGTPAGSDRQIQFNSGGVMFASSGLIYSSVGTFVVSNVGQPNDYVPVTGAGSRMIFVPAKGAFRVGGVDQFEPTVWDSANIGDASIGMGLNAWATNYGSVAIGRLAKSYSIYAYALGDNAVVNGWYAYAIGQGTTADGNYATALGQGSTASGIDSFAIGRAAMAGNGTAGNGQGDGSMAVNLVDDAVTLTTPPKVTGIQSLGIFMGDQDGGITLSTNNQMSLLGGKMVIDPRVPAQLLKARGVLDLGGATDALVVPAGTDAQRPTSLSGGMIRFSSTSNTFEGYNGTAWGTLGGSDTTPAAFSFTDQTNVGFSTLIQSNIVQITGISGPVNVFISGGGSPQFRVCSTSNCSSVVRTWTSDAGFIDNNQYLQIQITTAPTTSTAYAADVVVGTGLDSWSVTTKSSYDSIVTIINNLGLATNLKVCLDAGDSSSYSSGQSWLDLSGGGYDFFRGTTSGVDATDPTFNGTPGGLSANEYWSSDGGDCFVHDSANAAWMDNMHKDNTKHTILAVVWRPSNTTGWFMLGSTQASGAERGIEYGVSDVRQQRFLAQNGSGSVLTKSTDSGISSDLWSIVAVDLDETGQAFFWNNGAYMPVSGANSFSGVYTSPTALAASRTYAIGSRGGCAGDVMPAGSRIAAYCVWQGTNIGKSNLDAIWSLLRGRYGL